MIDSGHASLSIARQCALVGVSRSGFYYRPSGETELNLTLMRLVDEQHLKTPYYGSRKMAWHAPRGPCRQSQAGPPADAADGRCGLSEAQHQQADPRSQGLPVLAARPHHRSAQPSLGDRHHVHPDAHGFLYLVAIMDWASRNVLSWRLSNTMDANFCVEALEEALGLTVGRRSSTPTRAASSPRRLHACWRPPASGSAWTAKVAAWTMFSSSGCGGH